MSPLVAYVLGLLTLPILFGTIFLLSYLLNVFFFSEYNKLFYQIYCYYNSKNKGIEDIIALYRGEYISEKHFKKLAFKNKMSKTDIEEEIKRKENVKEII